MKTVLVASTNKAKIEGARQAFERFFYREEFKVVGVAIPPEVAARNALRRGESLRPQQPRSDEETRACAFSRLTDLMDLDGTEPATFLVALEAGVAPLDKGLIAFTWASVFMAGSCDIGEGRSQSFILPPRVVEEMNNGHTMIEACKRVYPTLEPNPFDGLIAILSDGILTRTEQNASAVMMALLGVKNPFLFSKHL